MRVAVIQSNYLPWKGYFDVLHDVDRFIFYDDVQYTTESWRNRNRVKGHQGPVWLTVPVGQDAKKLRIQDVTLPADGRWAREHWKTLQQYYSRAPFFRHYAPFFEQVYLERSWTHLSALNQHLITAIAREFLGLTTEFQQAGDYTLAGAKQERLLDLLHQCGATSYVSGPTAQSYLEPERFVEAGIDLYYKNYAGYPEYPQRFGTFEHAVSVVDLLFNVGPEAPAYIWGWRSRDSILPAGPRR